MSCDTWDEMGRKSGDMGRDGTKMGRDGTRWDEMGRKWDEMGRKKKRRKQSVSSQINISIPN